MKIFFSILSFIIVFNSLGVEIKWTEEFDLNRGGNGGTSMFEGFDMISYTENSIFLYHNPRSFDGEKIHSSLGEITVTEISRTNLKVVSIDKYYIKDLLREDEKFHSLDFFSGEPHLCVLKNSDSDFKAVLRPMFKSKTNLFNHVDLGKIDIAVFRNDLYSVIKHSWSPDENLKLYYTNTQDGEKKGVEHHFKYYFEVDSTWKTLNYKSEDLTNFYPMKCLISDEGHIGVFGYEIIGYNQQPYYYAPPEPIKKYYLIGKTYEGAFTKLNIEDNYVAISPHSLSEDGFMILGTKDIRTLTQLFIDTEGSIDRNDIEFKHDFITEFWREKYLSENSYSGEKYLGFKKVGRASFAHADDGNIFAVYRVHHKAFLKDPTIEKSEKILSHESLIALKFDAKGELLWKKQVSLCQKVNAKNIMSNATFDKYFSIHIIDNELNILFNKESKGEYRYYTKLVRLDEDGNEEERLSIPTEYGDPIVRPEFSMIINNHLMLYASGYKTQKVGLLNMKE